MAVREEKCMNCGASVICDEPVGTGKHPDFNMVIGPGLPLNKMPDRNDDPWAHRSAGMRCASCMWFVVKVDGEIKPLVNKGRCRRHAPTMSGYPVVFENDWCGDHKLA